ncbi:MAG: zinc-ribbon domain-containing protein, partial [Clostridiaceae bacterium]|nr:zinc-ribbon domain-containing protein [Clostridiaceae bacterium]
MKTCPNCSSENRDEAMFCTKCGTKFEEQPINTD